MPPAIKNEFSRNPISTTAAIVASVCSLAFLLSGIWFASRWTEQIDQRLSYNERGDQHHHSDRELHTKFENQVEAFVTRSEWIVRGATNQRQFDEIKASQIRQENKIDKIYEIIR